MAGVLKKREWQGLAAAPAPFFALLALPVLFALIDGEPGAARELGKLVLITYGPVLALGLPAHLLLRRFGRHGLGSYLMAGFVGGLVLGLLIYAANDWLFPLDPRRNPFTFRFPIKGAPVPGVLALIPATIFWLTAVRHTPPQSK
jgi:hypothetical protein